MQLVLSLLSSPHPSEGGWGSPKVRTGTTQPPDSNLFENVPSFFLFGRQIPDIPRVRLNLDRYSLDHFQPVAFDANDLSRVIRNQLDLMQAEIRENLGTDAVIPQIGLEAELEIRLHRVAALIL